VDRVLRGGSYEKWTEKKSKRDGSELFVSSAVRYEESPDNRAKDIGFRLVALVRTQ
jgi:hypothetical protein